MRRTLCALPVWLSTSTKSAHAQRSSFAGSKFFFSPKKQGFARPKKSIPFRKILERLEWVTPESGPPIRIGLDIGGTSIRTLTLEHSDVGVRLLDVRLLPCQGDPLANLTQDLKRIFTERLEDNVQVNAAVSGASTLVRYISMPKMSEKEFKQSMAYEAEKYIPYQINDVVVDSHLLGNDQDERGKKITKGILAVCKKEAVKAVIQACREVEAPLAIIDAPPLAIINAFQFNYPDAGKQVIGLLYMSHHASTLSIIHKGEPVFTREISFGGTDITQAISKVTSVSIEQAEKKKIAFDWERDADLRTTIKETLGFLSQEIRLSFNYFENHVSAAEAPTKLYVTGSSTQLDHLIEILASLLGIEVLDWDPFARVKIDPQVEASRVARLKSGLAVCTGLAVRF